MGRLGGTLAGSHAVQGSHLELFSETDRIFAAMISDIDSAKSNVLMEFYIWNKGGQADEVLQSLVRPSMATLPGPAA